MQRSAKHLADMDSNNDGLDMCEFRSFLRVQLEGTKEQDELDSYDPSLVQKWFDCLDRGGDGRLNKAELFGFMLKQAVVATGHRSVTALLKSFPELTGGPISLRKLASVVTQLGFDAPTAADIMAAMDRDNSGLVNFGELEAWSKAVMKNGEARAPDGSKPLDSLSSLLERGRERQGRLRTRANAKKRADFKRMAEARPELLQVQRALGNVMPTEEDARDSRILADDLRRKVDEALRAEGGPSSLMDMLESWDLGENGAVSLKELYISVVLIGLEPSAAALQLLFDELDTNSSYSLTIEDLTDFMTGVKGEHGSSESMDLRGGLSQTSPVMDHEIS